MNVNTPLGGIKGKKRSIFRTGKSTKKMSLCVNSLSFSGKFHKHFTLVNYDCSKRSYNVHCTDTSMQRFQSALAYFAPAVSYRCKLFMKSTPDGSKFPIGECKQT